MNDEDSSGYAATMALRMGTRIALKGLGRSALPSLAGSITPAGWVVIGVVIVCGIVYAKTKKEKRKEEVDPYARPGQKKQGREVKSKSRRNKNFKSNNNKRNNKPAKPKSHTPMRDHQKYKQ